MPARPARISSAGQLALELPLELPPIALAPEWKDQQRLWGHAFHPMCSYLASFPAALTHAFIARYSRPGDVVLDPFSGRGTTPLQACAEGRVGVGNDLNPFAHLLTAAKVEPATRAQAVTRLAALRLGWNAESARLARPRRARDRDPWRPGSARCRSPGRVARPPMASNRCRSRSPWPSIHGRSGSCCTSGRRSASRIGRTDSSRPLDRDPPRQERELSVRAHAQHVLDGAPLRARLRRPDRRSSRPTATSSTAWARSSTGCSASRRPRSRGSPCWVTRATSRRAPGRPCGPAGGPSGRAWW